MLRCLGLWAVGLTLLTLAGIAAAPVLAPSCDRLAARPAQFDTAIVLGSAVSADGRLSASARNRVAAGVALYKTGTVTGLIMTGAGPRPDLSAAAAMAAQAERVGVPQRALRIEGDSHSTLQNALFSKPLVGDSERIVLVTEGFHLSRSWASFIWAGLRPDALCHSAPLTAKTDKIAPIARRLVLEVLATWFNLARASGYSFAIALGAAPEDLRPMLR